MTDEQINIAIAESMEWKWDSSTFQKDRKRLIHHTSGKVCIVWGDGSLGGDKIPNYISDLNACHECVKTLTDAQRTTYREHLSKIWTRDYNSRCGLFPRHDDSVNATARQRCEAYLRTIEKWKEKVND